MTLKIWMCTPYRLLHPKRETLNLGKSIGTNRTIMHNNKKNEELQSRREFFKNAAKGILPIVGAIVLSNVPSIVSASEKVSMSCEWGCSDTCRGSCEGSCYNTCRGGCDRSCRDGCEGNCRGTCSGTSRESSTGGCKRNCWSSSAGA